MVDFFSGRLKFYPKALLHVDFFKAQGALTVGHVATQVVVAVLDSSSNDNLRPEAHVAVNCRMVPPDGGYPRLASWLVGAEG